MDTYELLRKITTLPIIADSLAEDMLAGNFRSVFKGQGMEFDEARHYLDGDDVRSIDWNASARFGTPFVKMYREERELTIMLLLDTSASMRHSRWIGGTDSGGRGIDSGERKTDDGAEHLSPYEQGLIAAALIALSAERAGQRVGAFLFDREIDRVFPPRRGRHHAMALISAALQYQSGRLQRRRASADSTAMSSNLRTAITGAERLLKRRSMVVLISDFISLNWEQELGGLSRKHDVIAIRISDPLNNELPELGLITLEDPETHIRITAPTTNASFQETWSRWNEDRRELWQNMCRKAGAAHLELPTGADAAALLFHFFGAKRPHTGRRERQ